MTATENQTMTAIMSGGIATTAVVFFRDAVIGMIPWLIVSLPLILLDLIFGIKAARHRGERVRFSKAFRRTFGKMIEYLAWVCFAATASLAFSAKWIEWVVLGAVIINELASVVGNYAETKDVEISWAYLWNKLIKIVAGKHGVDEPIDVGEIVKPKPARDEKGRFIKKEGE